MAVTLIEKGAAAPGTVTMTAGTNAVMLVASAVGTNSTGFAPFTYNGKYLRMINRAATTTFGGGSAQLQIGILENYDVGTYTLSGPGGTNIPYMVLKIDGIDFANSIDDENTAVAVNTATEPSQSLTSSANNGIAVSFLMGSNSPGTATASSTWTKIDQQQGNIGAATCEMAGEYRLFPTPSSNTSVMQFSSTSSITDWVGASVMLFAGAGYPAGDPVLSEDTKNMRASKRRYRP